MSRSRASHDMGLAVFGLTQGRVRWLFDWLTEPGTVRERIEPKPAA